MKTQFEGLPCLYAIAIFQNNCADYSLYEQRKELIKRAYISRSRLHLYIHTRSVVNLLAE